MTTLIMTTSTIITTTESRAIICLTIASYCHIAFSESDFAVKFKTCMKMAMMTTLIITTLMMIITKMRGRAIPGLIIAPNCRIALGWSFLLLNLRHL